jgi:hypothetical protein
LIPYTVRRSHINLMIDIDFCGLTVMCIEDMQASSWKYETTTKPSN